MERMDSSSPGRRPAPVFIDHKLILGPIDHPWFEMH
jgi:hypothetical protein